MSESDAMYWKHVDSGADYGIGDVYTFERKLPNGILVMTQTHWNSQLSVTVTFVPNPVTSIGPYR